MPYVPVSKTRPVDCAFPQAFAPGSVHDAAVQIYPTITALGDTSTIRKTSVTCLDEERALVVYEEFADFDDLPGDTGDFYERVMCRIVRRDGTVHAPNLISRVIDPANEYFGYTAWGRFNVVTLDATHALVGLGYATDGSWDTVHYIIYLLKFIDDDTVTIVDTYESDKDISNYGPWNEIAIVPGTKKFIASCQGQRYLIAGQVVGDSISCVETQMPLAVPVQPQSDAVYDNKVSIDEDGRFLMFCFPKNAFSVSSAGFLLAGQVDLNDLTITYGDYIPFPDQYLYDPGGDFDPPIIMMTGGEFLVMYVVYKSGGLHHQQAFGCPLNTNDVQCPVALSDILSYTYDQLRIARVQVSSDLGITAFPPNILDANPGWDAYNICGVRTGEGQAMLAYGTYMLYDGAMAMCSVSLDDQAPSGLTATLPTDVKTAVEYDTWEGSGSTMALWGDGQEVVMVSHDVHEIIAPNWPSDCTFDSVFTWNWDANSPDNPDDFHTGATLVSYPVIGSGSVSFMRKFNPYTKDVDPVVFSGFLTHAEDIAMMSDGVQRRTTYNRIYVVDNGKLRVLHHPLDEIVQEQS